MKYLIRHPPGKGGLNELRKDDESDVHDKCDNYIDIPFVPGRAARYIDTSQ